MLNTGSGPNIIRKKIFYQEITLSIIIIYILKLNGINEYPVYILENIILLCFENKVTFHIVSNDFPIT